MALPESRPPGPKNNSPAWWTIMLRDPQWWVPLVVLAAGLIVLRWIS